MGGSVSYPTLVFMANNEVEAGMVLRLVVGDAFEDWSLWSVEPK